MIEETICVSLGLFALAAFALGMVWLINKFI